jgi:hypothetical protein
MSDVDEKLIVKLGQRIAEQTEILRMIAASLQGVEAHLRQMAVSSNTAPNYQRLLSEYPTFDWTSIGATALNRDVDGVTSIEWNGQVFTRRSPSNKSQCAIWFSRHCARATTPTSDASSQSMTATLSANNERWNTIIHAEVAAIAEAVSQPTRRSRGLSRSEGSA